MDCIDIRTAQRLIVAAFWAGAIHARVVSNLDETLDEADKFAQDKLGELPPVLSRYDDPTAKEKEK